MASSSAGRSAGGVCPCRFDRRPLRMSATGAASALCECGLCWSSIRYQDAASDTFLPDGGLVIARRAATLLLCPLAGELCRSPASRIE